MVRVREARRAFKKFYAHCFWSFKRDMIVGLRLVEQLRKHGNREPGRLETDYAAKQFSNSIGKITDFKPFRKCISCRWGCYNLSPESHRYSAVLNYFHDSEKHVQDAFQMDLKLLESGKYKVEIVLQIPTMLRAVVSKDSDSVKIEWVHDTAWRF